MKRRDVTLGISFAIGLLLWQFSGIAQGSSASSAPDLSRPYWVASGKLIAFAADDNRTGPSLWMMRADGSQKQRLAAEAEYSSLSPNGRIVADFPGEGKTLVFRTPAGKRIRTFHLRPGPGDLLDGAPVWAPNERAVAFAIGREGPADDFGLIYVADTRTGVRVISRGHRPEESAPAWSPDGRQIAFIQCPDSNAGHFCKLMSMRPDGGGRRTLARNIEWDAQPVWSPDGRRLAFTQSFGPKEQTQARLVQIALRDLRSRS